jgi:hypothetical protein
MSQEKTITKIIAEKGAKPESVWKKVQQKLMWTIPSCPLSLF